MTVCTDCEKPLTEQEIKDTFEQNTPLCNECDISMLCGELACHLREARITFEEVIRKLIKEVDA